MGYIPRGPMIYYKIEERGKNLDKVLTEGSIYGHLESDLQAFLK